MSQKMGQTSDNLNSGDGISTDQKTDNDNATAEAASEATTSKPINSNESVIKSEQIVNCKNLCDKSKQVTQNGGVKSDEKTTKLKTVTPRELTEEECDEVLTVILSEEIPETDDLTIIEEKIEKLPKSILANNTNNGATVDKPPLDTDKIKASFRKKSVSFENDEAIKKFTGGEEIVDQENPFKLHITSETGVNYKFIKKNKLSKKSSIPASLPQAQTVRAVIKDSDYITKEEILKQSKYVPVYVKNPDRVLTYDKSIINRLSSVESEVEEPPTPRAKKVPIPAPRKISKLPALTASAIIGRRDTKKKHFLKSKNKGNYPDLSDIKVKTGTDWEESLYDPNEVAINVIKFDSLLKKKKYKSEDDSDETEIVNGETSSNEDNQESSKGADETDASKKSSEPKANSKEKDDDSTGKGSYTNTVTSSEFREFLRKKGLTLVPNTLKIQALNNKKASSETPHQNGVGHKAIIAEMEKSGEKKSSILKRLFQGSLFSSRKTSPKAPVPQPQQVFAKVSEKESARKRLGMSNGKSSVLADNEFTKHFSKERLSKKHSYEDDRGSSISSMLTAAEDYLDMQTPGSPKSPKSNYLDMLPGSLRKSSRTSSDLIQRSSEINRAKSAMLKSRPGAVRSQSTQSFKVSTRLAQPLTFEKSSPQPGDGVLKPKVQRPMMPNGTAGKQKPPVPVRTVSERALNNKQLSLCKENNGRMNRSYSMDRDEIRLRSKPPQPLERTTKSLAKQTPQKQSNVEVQLNRLVQLNDSPERTPDGPVKTSTPKNNHQMPNDALTPMTKDRRIISPVAASQPKKEKTPEMDPYLYVKLHELKRKTDDELFAKASQNSNSVFPKAIYGKAVNGPPSVPAPNNIYEQRPPIPMQMPPNGNFVRNSPQRSTVAGVVRPKTTQEEYQRQVMSGNYGYVNGNVVTNGQNQPLRSQSVLDGVTGSPMYGSMRYRSSNNSTPVQLRKGGTLDRKHILNQIYEFYRRSVNNTPVNKTSEEQLYSRPNSTKNVSPNSYASVRVHQPPPEARQRSQSVQQQPIYGNRNAINAAIYAQARSISQTAPNVPNGQRISTTSDNDSVFLPPAPPNPYKSLTSNNKEAPRKNYVIMEGEQITPWDVLKYRSVPNTPQRDQIYSAPRMSTNPRQDIYGKVYDSTNQLKLQQQQRRPASVTPYNGQPTYQPSQANGRVRLGVDGRSTPLILSSTTATGLQSPMKATYVEPMYRPIQMNRRPMPQSPLVMQQQQQQHLYPNRNSTSGSQELIRDKSLRLPVPYESDTGSEAGEIQRILYNRQNAISSAVSEKKSGRFCPEIKGSVLISACNCNKRNGLQMECRRSDCQGKVKRRSDTNQMKSCTHHSFQTPDMNPVCPEIISNDTKNENHLQVSDDMPIESALKPEEMSDIVYVDYGHNAFPDGNMQQNNMMNPMYAQMNQEAMQKMSPQMMNQMMATPVQGNHGTGDQKGQKMSSQAMSSAPQGSYYYPQQVTMPQNMSSIPHVQMGDGKAMEMMSSMPQGQQFSMPGYNMMSQMPQMPQNYYPMMQGQMAAPMMQAPMMSPMTGMNMQSYAEMQNPGQN